jgi:hypothetical protein
MVNIDNFPIRHYTADICSGYVQAVRSRNQRLIAVRTRCSDHATTFYPQKLILISPTSGGRSVSIGHLRTNDHGVCSFVSSFFVSWFVCLFVCFFEVRNELSYIVQWNFSSQSPVRRQVETSNVALGVVTSDQRAAQCLAVHLGHPDLEEYKYRDLAQQVGGVSNSRHSQEVDTKFRRQVVVAQSV